jgi:hypothetical protein
MHKPDLGSDRLSLWIEGENTVEGDLDNDTTASGGVPQAKRERTNA